MDELIYLMFCVAELLLSPFPTPLFLPVKRHTATRRHKYIYIYICFSYISTYTVIIQQHKLICPMRFKGKKKSTHILNVLQNRGTTGNSLSSKAATHHSLLGFLPKGTPASLTYWRSVRTSTCCSLSFNDSLSCGRAEAASVSHSDWAAWITPCNTNKYINNKWRNTEGELSDIWSKRATTLL